MTDNNRRLVRRHYGIEDSRTKLGIIIKTSVANKLDPQEVAIAKHLGRRAMTWKLYHYHIVIHSKTIRRPVSEQNRPPYFWASWGTMNQKDSRFLYVCWLAPVVPYGLGADADLVEIEGSIPILKPIRFRKRVSRGSSEWIRLIVVSREAWRQNERAAG